MVGGEIFRKALVTSGESSPKSSTYPGRQIDKMTLRRFEQGQVRGKPDFFQGVDDRLALINGRFPSFLCLWFGKAFEPLKNPNGMFAVISAGCAEFIQDGGFFMTGSIFIS
jgi:hypothetical protein